MQLLLPPPGSWGVGAWTEENQCWFEGMMDIQLMKGVVNDDNDTIF